MRITDPRWPAVRELARTLLRTEALVVEGPPWLESLVHQMNIRLGDIQPSRTLFPTFESTSQHRISLRSTTNDQILAQCSAEEPPLDVVWLPMETEDGWSTIWGVTVDLLDAGYPGCLGCGGPHTEGEWDEHGSRQNMGKSTN